MLKQEKVLPGLYAIHTILFMTRYLVGEGLDSKKVYQIMDDVELLPALIARPDDTTAEFREMLGGFKTIHPMFGGLVANFDSNRDWTPTRIPVQTESVAG